MVCNGGKRESLYEAGEGEEDGWELAEMELIENASHGDGHGAPELDAFSPEREADRSTAVYGETDEFRSIETDEDSVWSTGTPRGLIPAPV